MTLEQVGDILILTAAQFLDILEHVFGVVNRENKRMKRSIESRRVTIRRTLGCAFGVALVLLIGLYLLLKPAAVDRQDYGDVARAFADSLLDNNVRVAKSLTTPEQWGRINAWIANHPPFSCPFSWDIDNERSHGTSLVPKDGELTAVYHHRYQCAEEGYSLTVGDIILERKNEGWLVVEWSRVCESWDWEETLKCE